MQGFKGDKGEDGKTFEPMIGNVSTLSPGSAASVTSNYDLENDIMYFNFGIPAGEKGPQGEKGEPGYVDMATFDVIDGKLIMRGTFYSDKFRENYLFQLNDNKLEVVLL